MTEQSPTKSSYSVPPVERAIRLLRYVGAGNRSQNLSIVSRELGINRTTLIRLIHTLIDQGMIEELADRGGYRLGPGLVSLGAQAIQDRDIVRVCQPILARLCETTGMSAHLGILDGREIIYLSRETPNAHLVSNVRAGSRLPAHASSIGRAILAELPETKISQIFLGHAPQQVTEKSPRTVEDVIAQARADHDLGYAWSQGNFERGIGSCAAAVFDHMGEIAGALNVSGPEVRFTEADEGDAGLIRNAVVKAAQDASKELGYLR